MELPKNTKRLVALFLLALVLLIVLFYNILPPLTESDKAQLRLPRSIADVRTISRILSNYTQNYYYQVMGSILALYIFLQAFSVPGTIFLNLLSGTIFGIWVAFPLTLIAATLGASSAYGMSYLLGYTIVQRIFPQKLKTFSEAINRNRHNLFYFLLFLRISPLLPNWFVNISSPLLDVPFSFFFWATFLGIIPATLIAVNAGVSIHDINDDLSQVLGINTFLTLMGIALLSLIPVLINKIRGVEGTPVSAKKDQ